MKNVYIIGAQSTGKTTLVNALETPFEDSQNADDCLPRPTVIREVARTVLKSKGYSRDDITRSRERALQLQKDILEAQHKAEIGAQTADPNSWCICDRSGLDPIVYTACFVGSAETDMLLNSTTWLALESRMQNGVVILCEAGGQWLIDDGVRLMPSDSSEWMHIDNMFRSLLETRCIEYSILPRAMADSSERAKHAWRIIKDTCGDESVGS